MWSVGGYVVVLLRGGVLLHQSGGGVLPESHGAHGERNQEI